MFSVQHKGFGFKTKNLKKKNNIFWSKGGLQQNGLFYQTCVLENVKSYRFFFAHFLGNFWVMFKNTVKIGVSAHFKRPKIEKKAIFNG